MDAMSNRGRAPKAKPKTEEPSAPSIFVEVVESKIPFLKQRWHWRVKDSGNYKILCSSERMHNPSEARETALSVVKDGTPIWKIDKHGEKVRFSNFESPPQQP